MEPWRLKKEFENDLCFCEGIDTQELLPRGTPEEVKEGAKNTIKICASGGGYIWPVSNHLTP